jgi:SDR family mycofactocin-dependent oxidoreductase
MGTLDGKVALVSGGARGIGRAAVLAMAREGADIAVLDIADGNQTPLGYSAATNDELDQTVKDVMQLGRRALALICDVRATDQVQRAVEQTLNQLGPIDILVCNAGVILPKPAWELTEEEWKNVLDVNLTGYWRLTKFVAPVMIKRHSGRIIMVSSVGGLKASGGNVAYTASKFGVVGLAKSLAIELASYRITVNTIHPGLVDTEMVRGMAAKASPTGDIAPSKFSEKQLFNELIPPEDIGQTIGWLASDEARYVTGHAMVVDGGYLIK